MGNRNFNSRRGGFFFCVCLEFKQRGGDYILYGYSECAWLGVMYSSSVIVHVSITIRMSELSLQGFFFGDWAYNERKREEELRKSCARMKMTDRLNSFKTL